MLSITIGNFDGVHCGHARIVAETRRCAGANGRAVAVTFEPHPLTRLRPASVPPRLTSASERRRLLLAAGAHEVVELDPVPELLALDPASFLRQLRERLRFDVVVEGTDFRFGKARVGSIETLRAVGRTDGFDVHVVEPVSVPLRDGLLVEARSSLARWLIAQSRVRDVAQILGRPFAIVAATAPGDRRGRTIGFPTLNLGAIDTLVPGDGVFGGFATLDDGRRFVAAISVGTKPHFASTSTRTCEAHLLDAALPSDWYGHVVRFEFVTWIREQAAFPSLEALVARIGRDVDEIRARLAAPHSAFAGAAS